MNNINFVIIPVMASISSALIKNKTLLGKHYSKLGVVEGKWCFKHKVLLSYDKKKGWDVLKLNVFQLFFRNLGFYKSTHLKNVYTAWIEAKIADRSFLNLDLDKKILNVCKRHLLIGLGNADLSEAEVICFAEANHTDRVFKHTIGLMIDPLYQEGDVVLVEGYQAGRVLMAHEKEYDRPFARDHQMTQGWDVVDEAKSDYQVKWEEYIDKLKELSLRVHCTHPLSDKILSEDRVHPFLEIKKAEAKLDKESSKENAANLRTVINKVHEQCKGLNSLSEQQYTGTEFKRIQAWADDLLKDYQDLAVYFGTKHNPEKFKHEINKIIKIQKSQITTHPNSGQQCVSILQVVFSSCIKRLFNISHKANYKGATKRDLEETLKKLEPRNVSLCQQIDLLKEQDARRIFVVAGRLHLLFDKKVPYKGLHVVEETLQKHKFIIITPKFSKNSSSKKRFKALGPNLTRRSL